ncbi:hypothetical protein NE236_01515 [Actinoallomurus purpureus]|uniref:hypothetical protein n=1 Tax=Actinoallomurus purpureus TaxID=478114 RepID=UPI0020936DFB|nr:hypothetical protein [Actinoallomurus purpureus]MCO6003645.1 hypothetical protein [Actinoallomurus purpureus]
MEDSEEGREFAASDADVIFSRHSRLEEGSDGDRTGAASGIGRAVAEPPSGPPRGLLLRTQ